MNDRIDGIVVRQTDYRENSVIISVLTKNHGKISLTAAGARKMTSKNAAGLLPYTENEIWKMIPDDDSALFWLVEKTSCVLTDVNSTIGMKMTPAQQKTYEALSSRGIISDEYYDLTKQREKVKAARANA